MKTVTVENASLSYLTHETYVSDNEMDSILQDEKLLTSLSKSLTDIKKGKYRIVE